MIETSLMGLVVQPLVFGLIGFVEPCTIGTTLLMVKLIEGRSARDKIVQTLVFALTRSAFIGGLGLVAAVVGSVFLGFQKAAWLLLGLLYVALGSLYLSGRAGVLMRGFGPRLVALRGTRGAFALGLLFGLNIPACAAPLLLALLGSAAAGGARAAQLAAGFVALALFGLALSLPLVAAVFVPAARRLLDRLGALSRHMPRWIGLLLVLLGLWSLWFGLFVSVGPPRA